ncbi:hypothetical protein DFP72DRAFT_1131295 [Ephemerocybe angulata]|uniref:Uncharacterized protein n=1 Tax=Ephemerocybe angulata TaxID=980116 RepID=A0A8H6HUN5_9AGAR|nr:hypothetical protein DFP72DRAFT_1131295 [Tulosesus angulatus]
MEDTEDGQRTQPVNLRGCKPSLGPTSAPVKTISAPRRASAAKEKVSGKQESRKRQKQPPGAFAADGRGPRQASRAHAPQEAASPSVKPLRRTKRSVRQIPGGLMDDEDGDGEEEEEGDKLAPLREPSPPPITAKRTVRKARSVASPSEAGSDGEGSKRQEAFIEAYDVWEPE